MHIKIKYDKIKKLTIHHSHISNLFFNVIKINRFVISNNSLFFKSYFARKKIPFSLDYIFSSSCQFIRTLIIPSNACYISPITYTKSECPKSKLRTLGILESLTLPRRDKCILSSQKNLLKKKKKKA